MSRAGLRGGQGRTQRSATLILTVDHEVFGDGSGDIEACMTRPLERILRVAERHSVPVTLFVEILHLAACDRRGRGDELRPLVEQLRSAVLDRGHEVQLHLHPQWWAAFEGRRDDADLSMWRIGGLPSDEVERMGKAALDWLAKRIGSEIASGVKVFRAGGWCIQPERTVLAGLSALGLKADSTVAPALWNPIGRSWYDFRRAPDLPYWKATESLDVVDGGGLLEVPICTGRVSPIRNLAGRAARWFEPSNGLAHGCEGTYRGPGGAAATLKHRLWRLATAHHEMLDFCRIPGPGMHRMVRDWVDRHGDAVPDVPVVAIGHSKNFDRRAEEGLDFLLAWVGSEPGIRCSSFGAWLERSSPS